MQPKEFILPFLKKEQLTTDVYSFYFDISKVKIDFLPGQYIRMNLPIENPDERGNTRLFSITTSPTNKNELCITTRIIQSTFKKTLANLTPGTKVNFFGPFGRFVLDENETIPRIFLAGGIGITPFLSMLRTMSDKKINLPVALFASFKTPEEVILQDEIASISKNLPNIKSIYTITRPEESQNVWDGEKGHISKEMIQKYVPQFLDAIFFIAGPPAMVDAMEGVVKEMGIPNEQIKKEKFTGY